MDMVCAMVHMERSGCIGSHFDDRSSSCVRVLDLVAMPLLTCPRMCNGCWGSQCCELCSGGVP